ncbi:MAG: peptidoglycan DD-metalloendopeptidase family protein [Myxococcota bacterium]
MSTLAPLLSDAAPTKADPKDAAAQFERLLIGQLLNEMPIPGLEGTQAGAFLSMVHDALAEQLVRAGGLGLADEIEAAMRDRPRPDAATAPAPKPRVSSGFGYRVDPFDHTRRFHAGQDHAATEGTSIRAPRDGVVTFAGRSGGYGNLVVVDHGGGLETRYAHCASLEVAPGAPVAAGSVIATVGSTGRSTGPHVHFEVRRDGIAVDPALDDLGFAAAQQAVENPVEVAKGIDRPIRGEQQPVIPEGSP